MSKPRIVVSRCFLEPVRYNGEIIKDFFIEKLKNYVEFIDVCPEVDIGLGIPRSKLILIKENNFKRLIQPETKRDLTKKMEDYIEERLNNFKDFDGFILKAKSPSCGVGSAKLYDKEGKKVIGRGYGLFAEAIKRRFPFLPLEDEGRLRNQEIKKHFLVRIFTFASLRDLIKDFGAKKLVDFQTKHKYLLMTYSQKHLKLLGQIVAEGKMDLKEKIKKYQEIFYQAFQKRPSRGREINTLRHIIGHLTSKLNQRERKHLEDLITKYEKGWLELKVLLELIRNFAYRFDIKYLLLQSYLNPYPEELGV
ncbi:MAG: DUF523 and DUF1722 domain-containing protein [candidate division WOR-3 bacterium]|nr:DUF523 and DUF1722 domain-containing protein [candidate division WOR-3 bacterium]MCX7837044.1 DUF523 and DUF1722 domain-containing protein [candidate division WOR-3 bacterium]